MARSTADLLRAEGHDVLLMQHDSRGFHAGILGRAEAFARGIVSPMARREMRSIIRDFGPDVVHAHEVYPFHSPWVLVDCRNAGVPVVMTCHDFRLSCPVATHVTHGSSCVKCASGYTHWCVMKNCRENWMESIGYAARSAVANYFQLFRSNVSHFMTPSQFLRDKLVEAGYPTDRFTVVGNMVETKNEAADPGNGLYAAYAGRLAPEKGLDTLIEAARITGVPLRVAGGPPQGLDGIDLPPNVTCVGFLDREALDRFYRNARFLVVPSTWWEVFGLVAAEGMMLGLPVIATRSGGLPEVVKDNVTGFLFEAGNPVDLADKITRLWSDATLRRTLGRNGRRKAMAEFTSSVYYTRLMSVYRAAVSGERVEEARDTLEAGAL